MKSLMNPSPSNCGRRWFLQTTTAALAVTSAVSKHALSADDVPSVHSGNSTIRIGLVGCGGRGSGAALNAMAADPHAKLELFKALRGERERINNGTYMCRSTMMAILGREVCYSGKDLTFDQVAGSPQKLGPEKLDWEQVVEVVVPQPGRYKFPVIRPDTSKQA